MDQPREMTTLPLHLALCVALSFLYLYDGELSSIGKSPPSSHRSSRRGPGLPSSCELWPHSPLSTRWWWQAGREPGGATEPECGARRVPAPPHPAAGQLRPLLTGDCPLGESHWCPAPLHSAPPAPNPGVPPKHSAAAPPG
jgi:hypothetical protein